MTKINIGNHYHRKKKEEFNKEFYNLISKSDYTIIVGMIDKEKMNDKNKNLLFHLAYSFIIERYEYFLDDKDSNGIVIMDDAEASKEILDLAFSHQNFMNLGIPVKREDFKLNVNNEEFTMKNYKRRKINRICENLIFLDDKEDNMLQITDMVAAAMYGKYNRTTEIWYNKIKEIIRHNQKGLIEGYGLKVFPEK